MEYKCLIRYQRVSIYQNFQRLFKRQCCKINVCRVKYCLLLLKDQIRITPVCLRKHRQVNCAMASPFAPADSLSTLFTALGQTLTLHSRLCLPGSPCPLASAWPVVIPARSTAWEWGKQGVSLCWAPGWQRWPSPDHFSFSCFPSMMKPSLMLAKLGLIS